MVLVLISIISIGAVGAVDDSDIGTGVLETTDDLSVGGGFQQMMI